MLLFLSREENQIFSKNFRFGVHFLQYEYLVLSPAFFLANSFMYLRLTPFQSQNSKECKPVLRSSNSLVVLVRIAWSLCKQQRKREHKTKQRVSFLVASIQLKKHQSILRRPNAFIFVSFCFVEDDHIRSLRSSEEERGTRLTKATRHFQPSAAACLFEISCSLK